MDRDMVAVVNLSKRGRLWFDRSQPTAQAQGGTVEAVMGNPTPTVIPGVDAPKLTSPDDKVNSNQTVPGLAG